MITIVDYDAGNPTSVQRALAAVGVDSLITPDASVVERAERIIFPGVGHARSTMAVLKQRALDRALTAAFQRGTPILGICVGAQLLLTRSEEGDTPCLDLVPGTVRRFPSLPGGLKVPHMGWNRIQLRGAPHALFEGLPEENEFYFVHSYYLEPVAAESVIATSDHGVEFACAFAHGNLAALQFHPEKSGPLGLAVLDRFARWSPAC
ncbi:MAG TPA: imidazole glycerol phosphate synthase subunit HisH [Polyangiaceae bacterium]|nr:imidazole glycerol phosphate synthase subunit HisH [Polyangiaceae bacterium]